MKKLTKRQTEILEYINSFFHSHGYSPSYRELMTAFGFSSVASVFKHMKCLESKGALQRTDQKWRALQPTTDNHTVREDMPGVHIPIIGSLAHGEKIELFQQMQETDVPSSLIKTKLACYGFLIKDGSFHEVHIKQGDLLIIEVRENAKPGEMAVCTSDEGKVSIIDFTKEHEKTRIHGVIIALLRYYPYEASSSSSLSGSKSSSA